MRQAEGRAFRHGQKSMVHFYQFVAARTIDVDILEHRRSVVLVGDGGDPGEVIPVVGFRRSVVSLRDASFSLGFRGEYASTAAHFTSLPDSDFL